MNEIIYGSCFDVLKQIPHNSIDLILFSPPYDSIRTNSEYNDDVDLVELGRLLYVVAKAGSICAVVMQDQTRNFAKSLTTFKTATAWVEQIGWRLFECCIYQRDGNPGAWWNQRFRVDHEYIMLFLKGDRPAYFNKESLMVPSKHAGKVYSGTDRLTSGGFKLIEPKAVNDMKCRGTIWPYATSNSERNKLKLEHPATFPDKLAQDIILCFSKENDVVLDPMAGSGTTLVMAKKSNRRFIGIERSEYYCNITNERLIWEA